MNEKELINRRKYLEKEMRVIESSGTKIISRRPTASELEAQLQKEKDLVYEDAVTSYTDPLVKRFKAMYEKGSKLFEKGNTTESQEFLLYCANLRVLATEIMTHDDGYLYKLVEYMIPSDSEWSKIVADLLKGPRPY